MLRIAFRMTVSAGQEEEYERRHRPIWPELEAALVSHGVHEYSIFLDPATGDLFAYAVIESEERWRAIADTDGHRVAYRSQRFGSKVVTLRLEGHRVGDAFGVRYGRHQMFFTVDKADELHSLKSPTASWISGGNSDISNT